MDSIQTYVNTHNLLPSLNVDRIVADSSIDIGVFRPVATSTFSKQLLIQLSSESCSIDSYTSGDTILGTGNMQTS